MAYRLEMGPLEGGRVLVGDPGFPPTRDRVVGVLTARAAALGEADGDLDGLPAADLAPQDERFRILVTDGGARAELPAEPVGENGRALLRELLGHLLTIQEETGWRIYDPQRDRLLPTQPRVSHVMSADDPAEPLRLPERTTRAGLLRLLRQEGGRRLP